MTEAARDEDSVLIAVPKQWAPAVTEYLRELMSGLPVATPEVLDETVTSPDVGTVGSQWT